MKLANDYIKANRERFLEELFDLLRIPSISAQPSLHKQDMVRCAEWLAASLVKAGADRAEVMPTEGNPVVYAEKIIDPKAKTVLVYGHYDVMPEDPIDEWKTNPFEPRKPAVMVGQSRPIIDVSDTRMMSALSIFLLSAQNL